MTDREIVEIEIALSQLRHAYTHLYNESVVRQRMFAEGLIHSQIKRLERLINESRSKKQ